MRSIISSAFFGSLVVAFAISTANGLAEGDKPPHFEDIPKMDVHSHIFEDLPELNEMMRRNRVQMVNVCNRRRDGQTVESLSLPREVLENFYYRNARRLILREPRK
jgi:hypothetical protein